MTQLDELLREHSERIPIDDAVERHAFGHAFGHARHPLRAAAISEQARAPRRRSIRRFGRFALGAGLAVTIAVVVAFLPGAQGTTLAALGRRRIRAGSARTGRPGDLTPRLAATASGPVPLLPRSRELPRAQPTRLRAPNPDPRRWIGGNGFARSVQTGPNTLIPSGDLLIFHATPQQLQAERQRQRDGAHLRILAYSQKYAVPDLD